MNLCRRVGFPWWEVRALASISDLLARRERIGDATARMLEALPLLEQMGDRTGAVFALSRLGALAARAGEPERAGKLWGAVEAEAIRDPYGLWDELRTSFEQAVVAAEGPEFEIGRTQGQHLTLEQAIAYRVRGRQRGLGGRLTTRVELG